MANSPYLLSLFCWFVALNRQICQSSYVALAATKAGLFLLFISKIIFSCLSGNAAEIATQWAEKIFEAKNSSLSIYPYTYKTSYLMLPVQRWPLLNMPFHWGCIFTQWFLFIDWWPLINWYLFIYKIIFSCLSGNAAEIATQWTKVWRNIRNEERLLSRYQWRGIDKEASMKIEEASFDEEPPWMKKHHKWREQGFINDN